MSARTVRIFLFLFLFGLLFIPRIMKRLRLIFEVPLQGEFNPAAKVSLSFATWFDGNFQKSYDKYYEENIGLRNTLIRIYNQVDYTFFKTTHSDVIVGKNRYLFLEDYLNAYIGKDFIGEEDINRRMEQINFVSDKLKQKGIYVIIAIAPTKVDFYAEYIPSFYSRRKPDSTNYNSWRKNLAASTIPFIDFNDLFLKAKDTSRFALYPKQGIHWSQYGMYVVADSLLKFMREETGIDMKNLNCNAIKTSQKLMSTDYDLGDLCNVLFKMKHDDMPYPILSVEDNPSKPKPNVLVIGDSYYWNLYNTEIPRKIFNGKNFWYYNYEAYTDSTKGPQKLDPANCMHVVEKQQVILIIQTVPNLNKLGFGFFDYAYLRLVEMNTKQ